MQKICTVVGARPQFIKAATLTREIAQANMQTEIMIHTGQHYDLAMSEVFFKELDIPTPKYNLGVRGGTHGAMTGSMLQQIEAILQQERPKVVVVYGDTNSTLAGALAAAKLNIPIVHVEAGLRSRNLTMPEEINRMVTDKISTLLCCPTSEAVKNLAQEGINTGAVFTGDVMYDAVLFAKHKVQAQSAFLQQDIPQDPYMFLTIHRAAATESVETLQPLLNFALNFAAEQNLQIIFPVHPRTKQLLNEMQLPSTLKLIEPVSYLQTQAYVAQAQYVVTDSGGLQKEAYFHSIPCITLRNETEWVETINHGWNRLWKEPNYKPRSAINEYGDGKAAQKISNLIADMMT